MNLLNSCLMIAVTNTQIASRTVIETHCDSCEMTENKICELVI